MSSIMALRRSPKPGALTATTLSVPRSLLTTRVANASPSTSSAMMTSGLPWRTTFSRTGSRSWTLEIFFSIEQDERVVEDRFHPLGVGDHVGGDIALVELHSFDEFERSLRALGLFDSDDAVLADLVHRVGDQLADGAVLRGVGGDLLNGVLRLNGSRSGLDVGDDGLDGLVDPALDGERVAAGGDVLQTFADNGLRQNGGGRGAVTGDVVGLGGDFANELRAHVLELVFDLDLFGDGHAVVDEGRGAELLFENDVAAARAKRYFDGIGQDVDAALKRAPGLLIE